MIFVVANPILAEMYSNDFCKFVVANPILAEMYSNDFCKFVVAYPISEMIVLTGDLDLRKLRL
jgi:hypothetical protein